MDQIQLQPLTEGDIPLLRAWLYKPHVLRWYTDPEDWLNEVDRRHGEYAWIRHFTVRQGEKAIGFCQYYDCYDARELELWHDVPIKGDTFSIDYLIGETEHLGKGYGRKIVAVLSDVLSHEGARQVIVQPDEENAASRGALFSNGYQFDEERQYFYKLLAD